MLQQFQFEDNTNTVETEICSFHFDDRRSAYMRLDERVSLRNRFAVNGGGEPDCDSHLHGWAYYNSFIS